MQDVTESGALSFPVLLSAILVRIGGELLHVLDEVRQGLLAEHVGVLAAELEGQRQALAGIQTHLQTGGG